MNCNYHPETLASAFCRECGKALCNDCQRPSSGTMYCPEHMPAPAPAPAPASTPPLADAPSPGLAFMLGLIPGVGAIYNAQYAKGLVHVIIWGLLVSIVNSDASGGLEPLFGMMIPVWHLYMAFEAYHTARKRLLGTPVDEFSSLVPLKGRGAGFPVLPVVLIAAGTLFLLNNLEIVRLYQIVRYWPVFLIALGVYLLYLRVAGDNPAAPADREVSHERQ
ncbi:MAG: B-box zinc finger protein [Acidobacteria bacterium]|nr:B-box zinc finger protein [Acidobacteriota bacterium]